MHAYARNAWGEDTSTLTGIILSQASDFVEPRIDRALKPESVKLDIEQPEYQPPSLTSHKKTQLFLPPKP
jgi:hypothetical protein